ncbi:MAG: GNAT family N-acetyltransferase [Chloroflexota bacterium]
MNTTENQNITIRRAVVTDADVMANLRRDMQTELGASPGGHPVPADELVEHNIAYFREKLPSDDFAAFVAEASGEIVGTSGIVMYRVPPTGGNPTGIEGFVMNMYTRPDFRRQGISSRLLECVVQHARSLGARRVWLRASQMGRLVYDSYGFAHDENYMAYRIEDEQPTKATDEHR